MGVIIEEREPEIEGQEDRSLPGLLGIVEDLWKQRCVEGRREENGTPTGGSACRWGKIDGPTVDRHPGVGAVHLQQIKTGGHTGTINRTE